MGCSQGGVVSALTAAKLQKQVQNLILFYPALCIPDDARAGKMMFARFDPLNIPETFSCGPMKLGRDYAASVLHFDMIAEISKYTGRVLIVLEMLRSIFRPGNTSIKARSSLHSPRFLPQERSPVITNVSAGRGHHYGGNAP